MKHILPQKRQFQNVIGLFLLGSILFACKKKDDNTVELDDKPKSVNMKAFAEKMTKNSIANIESGLIKQFYKSIAIISSKPMNCGVKQVIPISGKSAFGASPSYSFDSNWTSLLNCKGSVPNILDLTFKGKTTFEDQEIIETTNNAGTFAISGFLPSEKMFKIGTADTINSTHTLKSSNNFVLTSVLILKSSNIVAAKNNYEIQSGTATIQLKAMTTPKEVFETSGSIKFLGNRKANLTIVGKTIPISW